MIRISFSIMPRFGLFSHSWVVWNYFSRWPYYHLNLNFILLYRPSGHVTPHLYEVPHCDFHHIDGICCWYLGSLEWLGGIHLQGVLYFLGIRSFDGGLWLGESHFSLAGWLWLPICDLSWVIILFVIHRDAFRKEKVEESAHRTIFIGRT